MKSGILCGWGVDAHCPDCRYHVSSGFRTEGSKGRGQERDSEEVGRVVNANLCVLGCVGRFNPPPFDQKTTNQAVDALGFLTINRRSAPKRIRPCQRTWFIPNRLAQRVGR